MPKKENKIEDIKKSFDAVIKALWEDPKADVFYVQSYAWDWVEEALKRERLRLLKEVEKLPTGMFDSTPYKDKLIAKLRK